MIQIQIPKHVEEHLRRVLANLEETAKETVLVGLYRQGHVTHHELGEALGLTRFEVDGLLKRHNVTEDLETEEEHASNLEALRKLLDQ